MTGEELFIKLTDRDFSNSEADKYAQLLMTIFSQIHGEIFPLLEQANESNTKLDVRDFSSDHPLLHEEILPEDIEFIDSK
jgi:hypothetical protein